MRMTQRPRGPDYGTQPKDLPSNSPPSGICWPTLPVAVLAAIAGAAFFVFPSPPDTEQPPQRAARVWPPAVAKTASSSLRVSLATATPAPIQHPVKSSAATTTGEAAKGQLRESGQYDSLATALQAARYAVEKIDPAGPHSRGADYFAANPGQQLRAWFSKDGIELASGRAPQAGSLDPAEPEPAPWSLALRLRAAGRSGALTEVAATAVQAAGRRVEMHDPQAAITQWFENGRDGVEQGFTLAKRPDGDASEVALLLSVEGNLHPEVMEGEALRFVDAAGADVLHYKKLKVWDASGRTLPARMEVRATAVVLLVADAEARYPVTVDPLFANVEARLVKEPVDSVGFGGSVAVSEETALVGSGGDATAAGANAGSAYVFVRSGTFWNLQQRLTASDSAAGDDFGSSVALSGDTALVGARNVGITAGSAYVFVRSGAIWSQQDKLASNGAPGDGFGGAVALSGDTALVGAAGNDTADGADAGSAYVFVRNGTTWDRQEPPLTADDGAAGDNFGSAVALSGETALIGAAQHDTAAGSKAGSAYVFVRSGTVWNQQGPGLAPIDGLALDFFGSSVALSGDTALVGASGVDTISGFNSVSNVGSAYVFIRSGTLWTEQAKLLASDGAANDGFGFSVALDGDTALVGAPVDATAVGPGAGSAYMFARSGTIWTEEAKLTDILGATFDNFGDAVALSGNTAVVGVPNGDTTAGLDNGSAQVFVRAGTSWSRQVKLAASEGAAGGHFGATVALSGNSALVGAPQDDTIAGPDAGSAYVFVRSGTLWSQQARLIASDGRLGDLMGFSVTLSGETALVGAPGCDLGADSDAGAAYVFARSGTLWRQQEKLRANTRTNAAPIAINNAIPAAPYPSAIAVAGVPGKVASVRVILRGLRHPYPDDIRLLLVGPEGQKVQLMSGAGGFSPVSNVDLTFADNAPSSLPNPLSTGTFLPTATDGTAFPSPAPANPYETVLNTFVSKEPNGTWQLYVHDRSAAADAGAIEGGWSLEIQSDVLSGQRLGSSVSLDGETALVGAPEFGAGGGGVGSAYVFLRSGTLWSEQARLGASNADIGDFFGFSVAVSGDTALVGAHGQGPGIINAGSAYVFVRSGAFWSQQGPPLIASGGVPGSGLFGFSVALSGDTALVGAPVDQSG